MNRRISWPIRILIILFLLFLCVYGGAITVMRTHWFHDQLERLVVQNLVNLTGARVSVRGLKLQPFALQLTINGLVLHGTEPPTQPPLLQAQKVLLRVKPVSLIRRRLLISSLYASGVEIHLVTYPDGSTNLPGPHKRPAAGGGALAQKLMSLKAGALVIEQSNLFWNNRKVPLDFAAKDVTFLLYYGGARGYWGSFSSSPLRFSYGGRRLPPFTLATHLELSTRGLDLRNLVWRSEGLSGNGGVHLAWESKLAAQATIETTVDLAELGRILKVPLLREGQFRLACRAEYSAGELSAQGSVRTWSIVLRSGPLASAGRVGASSDFSANLNRISLTHLRVTALGSMLEGEGSVRLRGRTPEFGVRLRLHGLPVARGLAMVEHGSTFEHLLPLAATVEGKLDATWRGSFEGLKSGFDLQLTPPRNTPAGSVLLQGFARGELTASPSVVLRLAQAQFEIPNATLSAEGKLGPQQPGLQVRYSSSNLAETGSLLERIAGISKPIPIQLKSPATFTGKITGTLSNAEIQGQLSLGGFNYGGWGWSGLRAGISVSPEHLRIDSGQLRSEASTLDFSGSASLRDWRVTPRSALSFMAVASQTPLRGLQNAFGVRYPVVGLASGRLQVAGTPASLAGSGSFEIEKGAIKGERVHLVSGRVQIANSVFDFENLLLEKGTGKATGMARFDLPYHSFSVALHGENFSLTQFKTLAPRNEESEAKSAELSGTADFFLQGHGTLKQPTFESTLSLHNVELEGDKLGEFNANFALQDERLQGEGQLKGEAGTFGFKAAAQIEGEWPSQISGSFANFHLDPWINWLGRGHLGAHPIATGSFKGEGPLRKLARYSFEAEAKKLSIETPDFRLASLQPVTVRYANRSLTASPFEMEGPSTNLQLRFSAQFGPPVEFSADAEGKSDASVLKLLDPAVQAVGSFSLKIHASGSVDHPSLSGQIGVHGVSVRYGTLLPPVPPLEGEISLKGNRVTIETLEGTSGQSSIHLTGYVTLDSVPQYNLQVQAQHLRMTYPSDFISILSGELHLTGSASSGELAGDITMDQMFVTPNFNFVSWLGTTGSSIETASISTPSGGTPSHIRLNIHVASNPEVRIVSRTLSFTATVDTTLKGTVANPVATGDIHFLTGQALIEGNRYTIAHGDITLANPFQTTPVLDVEVKTRIERYDLTIDVTGPVDSAKLAYRSDPPLPTEDILSLLALGYAPRQTMMSANGNQSFGAVSASALLSQALSSEVSGRVQQIFGVSRIRIDPNLLGPTTAGGARITIEEQVARNLTITYATNTAAAQQREIRIRWDITDKISLIGERDINGVFGVEIRFNRRLR
ncbi:MAG: translocation/assembly module TamB domain-containing protein [Terriglobia bacterium]